MYPTPAEPTILVYSIILTSPIVENMPQANSRREANPKLVQRFPLYATPQATAPTISRCDLQLIQLLFRYAKSIKIHWNSKMNEFWHGKRNMQQNGLALKHASRN